MGYLMYQSMLDCAWNSARLHRRKRQTVRSFFSSTALIEVAVRAVRDKSNPSSVSIFLWYEVRTRLGIHSSC